MRLDFYQVEKETDYFWQKILADPKEILILDEPTNDLDMETIDILIEFLKIYNGGVLVASHDKDFLEQVVDKYIFLDGDGNCMISSENKGFSKNILKKTEKIKTIEKKIKKTENVEKTIVRIFEEN